MRKYQTSLSMLAIGAVLSGSLVLGGCKNKDDVSLPKAAQSKVTQSIAKVKTRKVDDAQALEALNALSLNTSGSGELTWSDRSGSGGNYTFKNVEFSNEDDVPARVGKLELRGTRMDEGHPIFDQIVFNDVSITDEGKGIALKKFVLNEPSPDLAQAFADAFGGDEDAFDDIEGTIKFSAIALSGLKVDDKNSHMNLESIQMGKTKNSKGMFSLKNFEMNSKEKNEAVKMSLGSIEVVGVNIEKYENILSSVGDSGDEAMRNLMASMNPYNPDFKNYNVKNFKLEAGGMKVNLDSLSGKSEEKGGKITMSQKMTPLTITPALTESSKQAKKFSEALETLGFDKLEFSMSQTSIMDEKTDNMKVIKSYIELEDGFKLSYDYDMSGYKSYMDNIMAESGKGKSRRNPMASLETMKGLKINKFRLALTDGSIVERAFKLAAKERGGTPKALRTQAKMGLAFLSMMAQDEAQQQIATDLGKALGDWLEDGGTLIIDMAPAQALDLGALIEGSKNGDFDAEKLGLKIYRE